MALLPLGVLARSVGGLTSANAVTSITGTANQIIASASTGAITLSLAATITGITSIRFGSTTVGPILAASDATTNADLTHTLAGTGTFRFTNSGLGAVVTLQRGNAGAQDVMLKVLDIAGTTTLFSISRDGNVDNRNAASGMIMPVGSVTSPGWMLGPDSNTGGYAPVSNGKRIGWTANGVQVAEFSASGISNQGGLKRATTQFDKTSSTALADITGLSVALAAATSYRFRAVLFTTSNVAGGVQAAIASSGSVTNIIYEGYNTSGGVFTQTRATASGTAVGNVTAVTAATLIIEGTITTNAAGNLTAQFAQNVSSLSASSVLVGSYLEVFGA